MGIFKSIQRKIFLTTSLTICILVSILFVIEFNSDKKNLYERQVIRMKENSFTIRNSIESVRIPMLVQSILEAYAENILRHEDPLLGDRPDPFEIPPHDIHVVNTDDIVMASTQPDLIGHSFRDEVRQGEAGTDKVLSGGTAYSVEQMVHSGVKVLDVSVPIREKGTIIGALHYVEPYLKLEQLIKYSFIRHVLFALILIVSLSLLINFFLNKIVSGPITKLTEAMDGIRLKGRSSEITISSDDEIGVLAQSFNEMSQALEQREKEVKQYTSKLEDMVEQRTEELQESHAQLIQTEKMASMGKLAGSVAHEINNPIGIIVSRAECMLLDAKEQKYPELLLKDLEVIMKHSHRIATITKGILMFSRKSPAEFIELDIDNLIDETLLLVGKEFLTGNITVVKDVACEMPRVYGNGSQLQQVFLNLLMNARDAMPNGGEIKISSYCGSRGMVHISFTDSGTGIQQEDQGKVFDPFFSTKKEGTHTGLGLSITYGIIKGHNGEISVTSTEGGGTTFDILLPLEGKKMKVVSENE